MKMVIGTKRRHYNTAAKEPRKVFPRLEEPMGAHLPIDIVDGILGMVNDIHRLQHKEDMKAVLDQMSYFTDFDKMLADIRLIQVQEELQDSFRRYKRVRPLDDGFYKYQHKRYHTRRSHMLTFLGACCLHLLPDNDFMFVLGRLVTYNIEDNPGSMLLLQEMANHENIPTEMLLQEIADYDVTRILFPTTTNDH